MEKSEAVIVEYCDICTFPKEFCEFSPTPEKCAGEVAEAKEGETQGEAKEEIQEKKETPKKRQIVNIDVVQVKNRVITKIKGLDQFEVDLKAISKKLSKKIGCGCSKGKEGLELQGPNADQVIDVLIKEMKGLLSESNFEVTENIKKKKRKKKK